VRREWRWTSTPARILIRSTRCQSKVGYFWVTKSTVFSGFSCDEPGGTGVPLQKILTTEVYSSEPAGYFEAMIVCVFWPDRGEMNG
jgi:hypothetical protein